MHELSLCNALIEQVERIARERGARAVTRIELRIGPLSGVETPLLLRAWPLACAGTVAAAAELTVDLAEIRVRCTSCGEETVAAVNRLLCGACGDFRTRVVSGEDLLLERLELADIDDRRASARRVDQQPV